MQNKRVNEELLKNIKGYENRKAYVTPFASQSKDRLGNTESANIKDHVRRDKLVSSLKEAIE